MLRAQYTVPPRVQRSRTTFALHPFKCLDPDCDVRHTLARAGKIGTMRSDDPAHDPLQPLLTHELVAGEPCRSYAIPAVIKPGFNDPRFRHEQTSPRLSSRHALLVGHRWMPPQPTHFQHRPVHVSRVFYPAGHQSLAFGAERSTPTSTKQRTRSGTATG